jgi:hypothetical protein
MAGSGPNFNLVRIHNRIPGVLILGVTGGRFLSFDDQCCHSFKMASWIWFPETVPLANIQDIN